MGTEEQRKEKVQYDTRTFPEIYDSLCPLQQAELRAEIARRSGASRASVYLWRMGLKIPRRLSDRQAVSESIKKVVGVSVPQHLLFDIKK